METIELIKIQELFTALNKRIDELAKPIVKDTPSRSQDIKELTTALAKAQGDMPIAELNKTNPYFKSRYADFRSVVDSSRPSLAKFGLCVTQQIIHQDDGQSVLETTLWHGDQWIQSRTRIVPPKNDIQAISSYTTYLKRMAYAALIGVVTGDEDDDGEMAIATDRQLKAKGTALNRNYNPKENNTDIITKEQLEELEYELSEYPDIAEDILDKMRLQSIADLPKSKFMVSINRIREIKNLRNGNTSN